ncbi:hypothetical protein FKP32DRAFT_1617237 [Trametes sanguinea]|nr:hypothetical protein FKP32DRAFT_1617237 [Trametes sanguinea]
MANDEFDSAPSESESSEFQTQFIPKENDEEELWDVIEILEEKGRKYKVRWAGVDPKTKKPWDPTWVYKHDCTDKLIREWKKKQKAKKEEAKERRKSRARASAASSKKPKRSTSTSTATTTRQTRRLTKDSAPSTSTRATSHLETPQASSSRVTLQESKPPKRRRNVRASPTEDIAEHVAGPSRPRKKRKVEVEVVVPSPSSSETDEEELLNPQFLKKLTVTQSRSGSNALSLSPTSRLFLAQEEEENTQEAEGIVPSPPHRATTPSPPQAAKRRHSNSSDLSGNLIKEALQAGPSNAGRKIALQGRPSANDTFSREGIVPETQASAAPASLQSRQPASSQEEADELVDRTVPSTPPRAQPTRHPSVSGRPSSVKGKMKPNRSKELRPIPVVTPSVFRPHLPSMDIDEIEEFSSPERDTRKEARLNILTQESIELAQFTQDQVDSFVDWDGGAQPEEYMPPEVDPFIDDDEQPEPSLGPQLASPHGNDRRQAMASVLDKPSPPKQRAPADADISPEIPLMHELPSTSTSARAEIDSQSQQDILNSQIEELHTALEEKEQQLTQLELQIQELQTQLATVEGEKAQEAAKLEAELQVLREGSDEKSEQISQLESQLVELQLQFTHVSSEHDQERERHQTEVQELRESLEERNEQVAQLESALVELQDEIATVAEENEKLTEAQQQYADEHAEQLDAAHQRAASLQSELADVKAQLSKAEEESAALSARLESTIQDWERRYKDLESDRDLFKNLYSEASTHASRLAAENATLEERARVAEGQTKDGLALVRGTFEAQVRKLREEAEKWRAQCELLMAKDRATDDEVRRRAALEQELRAENEERLRVENELRLQVGNEQRLREESEERLRAEYARRLHAETDDWRRQVQKMEGLFAQMEDERLRDETSNGHQDQDADGDVDMQSTPPPAKVNGVVPKTTWPGIASPSESPHMSDEYERILYVCQHVHGAEMCNSTFASPQAVIEHAWKTHYAGL